MKAQLSIINEFLSGFNQLEKPDSAMLYHLQDVLTVLLVEKTDQVLQLLDDSKKKQIDNIEFVLFYDGNKKKKLNTVYKALCNSMRDSEIKNRLIEKIGISMVNNWIY